ncbi:MAG: choice-of-anchor B family protein [Rhodothermales bacterium]
MSRFFSFLFLSICGVALVAAQSAPDGTLGSRLGFGGALAMDNGHLFVGSAPIGWPSGSDPAGTVHQYVKGENGKWVEVAAFGASDGKHGDEFGRAIFVDDGTMMVAAPRARAVYVFTQGEDGWTESGRIAAPDLSEGHEFGGAYARGGFRTQTMARVGGMWLVTSYNGTTNEGAVHMVHNMGDEWHMMGTVTDAPAWSIAGSGNNLFVGTPSTGEGRGGVRHFKLTESGTWIEGDALMAEGLTDGAGFGQTLAVSGSRLFVGAPSYERFGAVFAFDRGDDGAWNHTYTIQESEPESEDQRLANGFGRGLSMSGHHLLVGANRAAFVFNAHHKEIPGVRISAPDQQAGNGFGVGVAIDGNALAVGAPDADYGSGLAHIFERGSDGEWSATSSAAAAVVRMESISGAEKIECEEGKAGLFPCEGVDLLSMVSTDALANDRGANLNDIWGWTDPESGREIVLAGRTDGTSFIDITDPANPVIIGQVMRTDGSPGAWWRDVKTYQNYAYIVADGSGDHGMQVFDLTRLLDVDPADMPVDFEPDMTYDGVASSHNIIINEETGFGYAVGSGSGPGGCGGQLHMLDLNDPGNPRFLGCYTNTEYGGTHDAQCVLYRGSDSDYVGREVCFNSNSNALILADVTDKENPTTITVAEYPNTAYTHQGWLSEDHNYFFMNDELDEMNDIVDATRTLIWDMSDLDEPILVGEYYHGNSASDHNLYVKGNLMYQSNYQAGLRILDITDPENPVEVASFDTAPFAEDVKGFAGSWSNYPYFKSGVIVVSSQAEGVFMLKKQEQDL